MTAHFISWLYLFSILAHTRAAVESRRNTSTLNDAQPGRLDRGTLVIQHATAYEFIGTPTHARQIVWLHLPVDIKGLMEGPQQLMQIAATLQDTCDAALIAPGELKAKTKIEDMKASKRRNKRQYAAIQELTATLGTLQGIMRMKHSPADAHDVANVDLIQLERLENKRMRKAVTARETQWQWLGHEKKLALAEAKAACITHNMTIPEPAVFDREYRFSLSEFMLRNNITHILIDSEYSTKDHMNRLPPHALTPPQAFPSSMQNAVYKYDTDRKDFVITPWALEGYDDDDHITYAFAANGQVTGYVTPAPDRTYLTKGYLKDIGMTDEEYKNAVHLPTSHVICLRQKDLAEEREIAAVDRNRLSRGDDTARTATVQLCYDTVDNIEVTAAKQYIKIAKLFKRHNIIVDTMEETNRQLTQSDEEQIEENRQKRFIPLLAGKAAVMLGKSIAARKFGAQMLPFIKGISGIRNLTPQSRRSTSLLKKFLPMAGNPLPIMAGVAGLGYNVWRQYRTNKKFKEQKELILDNQREIKQQATDLDVVTLAVTENTDMILEVRRNMYYVQDKLQEMHSLLHSIASTTLLQTTIMHVTQDAGAIGTDNDIQYEALLEILISAASNTVPGIFIPEIAKQAHHIGIEGDKLMPNPQQAVGVSPIVVDNKIDIYANFITGDKQWEMYKIYPLPKFTNEQAFTRQIEFEYALVGQGQGQFIALSLDEARQCKTGACEPTGVIRRINDDPCTIGMMAMKNPSKTCPIITSEETPFLHSTIRGLIFSVPRDTPGRLHCENSNITKIGVDQPVLLQGMGIFDIPTGCDFRSHTPEVIVLGPPHAKHRTLADKPRVDTKASSIRKTMPHEVSPQQERRVLQRAQDSLRNAFTATRSKISLVTTIVIAIGVAVILLVLVMTGKLAWLCVLHRKVRRLIEKAKKNMQIGKEALTRGMTSVARQADGVHRFFANRDRLNNYLKGNTDRLPLRNHISMINLEGGHVEHLLLGEESDEEEEKHRRPTVYPDLTRQRSAEVDEIDG